ncbi:hypothetical protein Cgig2_021261 [Carnegiea gigantea]|uniref:Uncharacterized protein n=1 Tax=Carnegiea gigantea TaxID=171969 RepID=A0A9Q1JZT5_9CARY|nr:hypothetical protein Cgig2_021261 [Carnegiea gigantea]
MGAPSFISYIDLHPGIPSIAFPCSLDTGEIAEYVAYHFEWDWRRLNGDRVFEARFQEKTEREEEGSDTERSASSSDGDEQGEARQEEAASPSDDDKQEATCLPHPLPDDYQDLCPRFSLSEPERAALDFKLPEIVQATFYAMLLNDAVDLGIVSGFLADDLKLSLKGLRWTSFEAWLSRTSRGLREAQLRQRTLQSEARGSMDSQEESSGLTSPPASFQ